MRYEKGHKDLTRQHILDVASEQFRTHGVAAAGVAGIMSEAGPTNGGFYAHFKLKGGLVQAVLCDVFNKGEKTLPAAAGGGKGVEGLIPAFLSAPPPAD